MRAVEVLRWSLWVSEWSFCLALQDTGGRGLVKPAQT